MIATEAQIIAQVAREYLQDEHPSGLNLEVVVDGVRKIDYWWQVQIRPDSWPTKTSELYDTLAEVETRIQEDKHLNILFSLVEPKVEQEVSMKSIITLANLKAGMNPWPPQWPQDFHNQLYFSLAQWRLAGLSELWWHNVSDELLR